MLEILFQKLTNLKHINPGFFHPNSLPSLDATSWFHPTVISYFEVQQTDCPSPKNRAELGNIACLTILRLTSPSTLDVLDQAMLFCVVGRLVHCKVASSTLGLQYQMLSTSNP